MSRNDSFERDGREWNYEILTVEGYDGQDLDPDDFVEADRVYYSVTDGIETYYRWLGGPYLDEDSVREAIEDEVSHYEELAG